MTSTTFPRHEVQLRQTSDRGSTRPWVLKPHIPVRLYYGRKSVVMDALVDSGADVTVFHSSLGKALGIGVRKGRKETFSGVAGVNIDLYFHTVKLQIVGAQETIEIDAGFTDSPGVGAILGQSGFFEHYRITFDRAKERMEIVPVKTQP